LHRAAAATLLAALFAYLNNPIWVMPKHPSQIRNTQSLFQKPSQKFSLKFVDTHYTVKYKRISG